MQAHRLIAIDGQQAVGIDGAQVVAGGERQAPDVGQRFDFRGRDAQLRELVPVKGDALRHALEGVLQAFELQLLECWTGQCL